MNITKRHTRKHLVQRWYPSPGWIGAAVLMILLLWVGRYAWSCWTARPAAATGLDRMMYAPPAGHRPPEHLDRTEALFHAIEALPPWPGEASAGSASCDLNEFVNGEWNAQDTCRQQLIRYFRRPDTRDALAHLIALSEQPFYLQDGGLSFQAKLIDQAATVLAVRARLRVLMEGDGAEPARDLRAMLNLASGLEKVGTLDSVLVALPCRTLAMKELLLWCQEDELPPKLVTALRETTRSRESSAAELWNRVLQSECEAQLRLLDKYYTRNSHGGGHMVPAAFYFGEEGLACPAARALNLLAFVFPDRREAEQAVRNDYERAEQYTPEQAMARMGMFGRTYMLLTRTEVYQRSARIALALEVYRHERGSLPGSLSALVPGYLPGIPLDPFDQRPLRYRPDGDGHYVLWSVGMCATDDGAHAKSFPDREHHFIVSQPRITGRPHRNLPPDSPPMQATLATAVQ